MENIKLETKYIDEISGRYVVESYQRGYRWGDDEVIRLLDDVFQNGKNNYCLQPIVVKKRNDAFELIDGQQRLTTIYLIYKYLSETFSVMFHTPNFTIEYKTRTSSAEYLSNLDFSKSDECIDFWFISNAYKKIDEWFKVDLPIRTTRIFEYFKENVKIIWYEVPDTVDAIALFTRLNIGKIPLTSAELVKAMFLSHSNSADMTDERQNEISLQWDNIEKELHNDSLWYFLTNNSKQKYQTRIDLVLDLISGKTIDNREKYFTYFEFDKMGKKEKSHMPIWRKIQNTFLLLKDWHEDHELYHKIGYLIASGHETLLKIFRLSENKTKSEFRGLLDNLIKSSIAIKGNYVDLSYDKPLDYKKISTLLLLFNVESVRQNGEQSQWFPFDKFKYNNGGKVNWSLEHIHAQQSDGLRTQETWKEWLKLHIPSIMSIRGNSELVKQMEEAYSKTQLERTEFESIQQQVVALLSVSGNTEYMHSIANLALLNTADNAALNNSTFDVKRNEIIRMDKEGQYIPFCTKMVFLKYYTPSADNQLHFWGQVDRVAYVNSINTVLKQYLGEPMIIEREII